MYSKQNNKCMLGFVVGASVSAICCMAGYMYMKGMKNDDNHYDNKEYHFNKADDMSDYCNHARKRIHRKNKHRKNIKRRVHYNPYTPCYTCIPEEEEY